jgi:O-antigen ligase
MTDPTSAAWNAAIRAGHIVFWAASAALFITFLSSAPRIDNMPWFVPVVLLSLAGVAAARPAAGLMALGCLVPVATWIGRTWNPSVAWPELLVVAFGAGYCVRAAVAKNDARDALNTPLLLCTVVVAASLGVRIVVLYQILGASALKLHLWQVATQDYFIGKGGFGDLDAAMRLLEGLLLFHAASKISRAGGRFAPRFVAVFVLAASVASTLNLWRLWQSALRFDSPIVTFLRYLATIRLNVHYGDVNAAGSYFAMALMPAVALTAASRRLVWMPSVVLVAASLMLSGSRTALAATIVAAAVWLALWVGIRPSRRPGWTVAVAALSVAIGAGTLYYLAASRNLAPSSTALEIRTEFARSSFRMLATRPMFGVGAGQYPERSDSHSSPRLRELFRARNENAHNNFLQLLAEFGIVGFAIFLWFIGAAGLRCARAARGGGIASLEAGLFAGLLAFVLSWLAGHPLLVDEPAFAFWLLFGTATGLSAHAAAVLGRIPHRAGVLAAALSLAIAVSIPVRARQEVADANLEHRGIGLSGWQRDNDGRQYRFAGAQSTIFVPADADLITVPLRSLQPGMELQVSLRLNGRLANLVRVPSDRWHEQRLLLPLQADGRRFHRLELLVGGAHAGDAAVIMVGKVEPR